MGQAQGTTVPHTARPAAATHLHRMSAPSLTVHVVPSLTRTLSTEQPTAAKQGSTHLQRRQELRKILGSQSREHNLPHRLALADALLGMVNLDLLLLILLRQWPSISLSRTIRHK